MVIIIIDGEGIEKWVQPPPPYPRDLPLILDPRIFDPFYRCPMFPGKTKIPVYH